MKLLIIDVENAMLSWSLPASKQLTDKQ